MSTVFQPQLLRFRATTATVPQEEGGGAEVVKVKSSQVKSENGYGDYNKTGCSSRGNGVVSQIRAIGLSWGQMFREKGFFTCTHMDSFYKKRKCSSQLWQLLILADKNRRKISPACQGIHADIVFRIAGRLFVCICPRQNSGANRLFSLRAAHDAYLSNHDARVQTKPDLYYTNLWLINSSFRPNLLRRKHVQCIT